MSTTSRKKGNAANSKTKSTKAHHSGKQSKSAVQQQVPPSRSAGLCQAGSERGLLESIGRLLTLVIKGSTALVLFVLIFNLVLVVLNTVVFKGRISQYIPAKSWRDILGYWTF